ncbi:hypothetical protein [Streptomyces pseudovenezuelae]|jgi:hypothetical protein|uniref:hypothetical protein n=1 Tax=Streptomyces pseudovenezuelae TaxID=67350 RepID=UPI0036E5A46F
MRVGKYAVKLDNGAEMRVSGAKNEADALQIAQRVIAKAPTTQPDSPTRKWVGREVVSVRLISKTLFG